MAIIEHEWNVYLIKFMPVSRAYILYVSLQVTNTNIKHLINLCCNAHSNMGSSSSSSIILYKPPNNIPIRHTHPPSNIQYSNNTLYNKLHANDVFNILPTKI